MVTLVQLYSEQEVFKTSPKVLNDTKVSRISIKLSTQFQIDPTDVPLNSPDI